jgi:hypothetical protein
MALCPDGQEVPKYYVQRTADLWYVLSTRHLRSLAYRCAVHYELKLIQTQRETEVAVTDW